MFIVLIIATALGVIDYAWQRAEHLRKNRMSRKELTDESKNSEGDPAMKQQRRQKGVAIAMNQMLADVPHLTPVNDTNADSQAALAHIQAQQPDYVSFSDWLILDQIEKEKGLATGRPRVKFTNISEMLTEIANYRRR